MVGSSLHLFFYLLRAVVMGRSGKGLSADKGEVQYPQQESSAGRDNSRNEGR